MDIIDLDPYTVIKWRMTEACNFHCEYCIRRPWNQNTNTDINRILKEADYISKIKTDRKVKVDMIGGEVTLLPLKKVYDKLKGKIDKVHITSNASAKPELYNELNEIIPTELCLSYHTSEISFDKYKYVAENVKVDDLVLETVSTESNQEMMKKFIDAFRDKYNIMVDIDRNNPNLSLIHYASDTKKPRYSFNNRIFYSKPELLNFLGNGKFIFTKGAICDRTHFIYICNGKIDYPSDIPGRCCDHISIDEIDINKVLRKKVCTLDGCTLCGHMSIL